MIGPLQEVDHCTPFVFPDKYKVPSYASSCVFRKSKPIYSTFTAMAVHATPGELRVFLTIFSCLSFRTKLNFSLFDGNKQNFGLLLHLLQDNSTNVVLHYIRGIQVLIVLCLIRAGYA